MMPGEYDMMDDAQSESNIRYGSIPQRVPRRYKTIKKVELFHGNFVLDSPVPTKLLNMCAQRNEREFTHMRYSAATCDPNTSRRAASRSARCTTTPRGGRSCSS